MPLLLRLAQKEDAHSMTDIYISAFGRDPIALRAFPLHTTSFHDFWFNSILEDMQNPSSHYICIYDSDVEDHPIVAYAKWNLVGRTVDTTLPQWPAGFDAAFADEFFGTLARTHSRIMQDKPHWYLELVATLPSYQGKGAGRQLVDWGTQKARNDQLEAFLEASPSGVELYKKAGFVEIERHVFNAKESVEGKAGEGEGGYVEIFMVMFCSNGQRILVPHY